MAKKSKKIIDWKNIISRAAWTFVQGFIGALVIVEPTKDGLKAALVGAVAGGLSALKTFIIEIK